MLWHAAADGPVRGNRVSRDDQGVQNGTANCFVASLSAPLLNTLFFMGYIVLVFYHTDYVQSLVLAKGASNPLMFVVLLTGVQGLVEAVVCSVAGTAIGGALLKVTGRMNGHR